MGDAKTNIPDNQPLVVIALPKKARERQKTNKHNKNNSLSIIKSHGSKENNRFDSMGSCFTSGIPWQTWFK